MSIREVIVDDGEFPALNAAACGVWDANADYWDQRMGEGNDFHQRLVVPAQERLLNLRPGETVLDIGCGNGQFARQMARRGADVLAVDVSPRMLEHARARTTAGERVEYRIVDATDASALAALGSDRFDAAVCTMAMMDMAGIDPLLSSLGRLLRPEGRFVFSVMHPCFNSASITLAAEQTATAAGAMVTQYSVRVSSYIRPKAAKGVAMRGQPLPQYYFDRPISLLFNSCFRAGFVLDGIEEPAFGVSADDGRANWANVPDIPPVLVARIKRA